MADRSRRSARLPRRRGGERGGRVAAVTARYVVYVVRNPAKLSGPPRGPDHPPTRRPAAATR
ncbi:hypothetical protein [Kitasatospora sp. NPDC057541]|uniref:hypothetical protein n=1 Tax=Kitasatospora sp. NPDC057541 TaxID=3346161 RepID=UPI003699BADA